MLGDLFALFVLVWVFVLILMASIKIYNSQIGRWIVGMVIMLVIITVVVECHR
jgi:hypothetical protein